MHLKNYILDLIKTSTHLFRSLKITYFYHLYSKMMKEKKNQTCNSFFMKAQEIQGKFPDQITIKTQNIKPFLLGSYLLCLTGLKQNVSKIKSKLSDTTSA